MDAFDLSGKFGEFEIEAAAAKIVNLLQSGKDTFWWDDMEGTRELIGLTRLVAGGLVLCGILSGHKAKLHITDEFRKRVGIQGIGVTRDEYTDRLMRFLESDPSLERMMKQTTENKHA